MMQVVVAGAGTPLGQALLHAIVERPTLTNSIGAAAPVQRIIAVDRTQPSGLFVHPAVEYVRGDYEQPRFLARVMGTSIDSIFDLSALTAGVEVGPVEASVLPDLEDALVRSLDSTRALLDACRFQTLAPKLVLSSLLAARPADGGLARSTVANCCALCEILVEESARRSFVDARCVRLPCVAGGMATVEEHALQAICKELATGAGTQDPDAMTEWPVVRLADAAQALVDAHELARGEAHGAHVIEVPGRAMKLRKLRL